MSGQTVTIGVPVYRGELFLEETLRSIEQQRHLDFRAIISIDGSDPASEAICQPFLKDGRFELVVQPQNLGWVGNINWLMERVETRYWCYQQQDDLLDPRYLEVLIEYAQRAPEAAVVYCDIESFGSQTGVFAQPSVTGNASARQLTLLYAHHAAVAFRGLTRVDALRHSGRIPMNEIENYGVDTTWMAVIARGGELHRVPVCLYRKRYHPENVHMKWWKWPLEKRVQAWALHCTDMLEQAMQVDATPQQRRLLWLAAVGRLNAPWIENFLPVSELQSPLLDQFLAYVRARNTVDLPALLESNWPDLEQTARTFLWRPSGLREQLKRVRNRLGLHRDAFVRLLGREG